MPKNKVSAIKFAMVYPLYVQKAERKHRTKNEVDQIICWLTGYDRAGLQRHSAFYPSIPSARMLTAS